MLLPLFPVPLLDCLGEVRFSFLAQLQRNRVGRLHLPPTSLLAVPGVDNLAGAIHHQPSSLFAATIFLAGALVGMGGLFVGQRVRAPPAQIVMRESLKKPLLVAKAEPGYEGGTPMDAASLRGSSYQAA